MDNLKKKKREFKILLEILQNLILKSAQNYD
jgi:hypothetical protein